MRKKLWNEDDVAFIIENFATVKTSDIANELGGRYSETQIRNKAKKLGLKKSQAGMAIHLWSADEDAFLIENYKGMIMEEIAIKLELDVVQVRNRVNTLGLKKVKTWSEKEEQYLIDNFDSLSIDELIENELHEFTPLQIRRKAHKLGLTHKKITYWTKEEIEILKLHYATKTNKYIQENLLPDRTIEQIKNKAQHLGIQKSDLLKYKTILDVNKERKDIWTAEEKSLLIQHYGKMNNKQLQKEYLPNRTLHGIRVKAKELNLQNKMRQHFQWEQTDIDVDKNDFNNIKFSYKKVKFE